MRSTEKRQLILQATMDVINEQGIDNLTLDKVCDEADISKGGLLYHFPSKKDLIKNLNLYVLDIFKERIHVEEKKTDSYSESYLNAAIKSLESDEMQVFVALSSYQSKEELSSYWNTFYEEAQERLEKECRPELVHIIQLVSDGLWFRDTFSFAPIKKKEIENICNYLYSLVTMEKG